MMPLCGGLCPSCVTDMFPSRARLAALRLPARVGAPPRSLPGNIEFSDVRGAMFAELGLAAAPQPYTDSDGVEWPCGAHAFIAARFDDGETVIRDYLRQIENVKECAEALREPWIAHFVRPSWENEKVDAMLRIVRERCAWHPALAQLLRDTRGHPLRYVSDDKCVQLLQSLCLTHERACNLKY